MREIIIERNDAGQRFDRFLKKYMEKAPLSRIYTTIRKDAKVNGKRQKEDYMLAEGDAVQLFLMDSELDSYIRKTKKRNAKRQFTVVYEDDNMIIVTKPFGLLVHGDKTEKKDTLANQVVDYLIETGAYVPRLEKSFTPSPVHRLDRNTTGMVVFGKNAESLRTLAAMMQEDGPVRKFYKTLVTGSLREELHLKNRLLKDEARNTVTILPETAAEGKYIETIVRPDESRNGFTQVDVELVTGRSHQIRAHLKHAGYPLIGDVKYGDRRVNTMVADRFGLTTQLLHAYKLEFGHVPAPLEYLSGKEFEAPITQDFQNIAEALLHGKPYTPSATLEKEKARVASDKGPRRQAAEDPKKMTKTTRIQNPKVQNSKAQSSKAQSPKAQNLNPQHTRKASKNED